MRVAKNWADYRLIDTKSGERLERWGNITLIRPDPQVIWQTAPLTDLWNHADGHYHRSKSGGGQWEYRKKPPESWQIRYRDLTFIVRPTGFKHTGLFPEQAVNWDWMQETIRNAGRPIRVLNLFAYTGGATLACAAAGAEVCDVLPPDAQPDSMSAAAANAAAAFLNDINIYSVPYLLNSLTSLSLSDE